MCVADIEGKGFRADASDVAAGINTGFFVRFGKLGIDIDNITLSETGRLPRFAPVAPTPTSFSIRPLMFPVDISP